MNLNERCTRDSIPFNSKGSVRQEIRRRVCAVIDEVLDEELEAALGAARHERTNGRAGYRNGTQQRTVVTERGPTELNIPRGRLIDPASLDTSCLGVLRARSICKAARTSRGIRALEHVR